VRPAIIEPVSAACRAYRASSLLGKSHLIVGGTVWLLTATAAPELLGRPTLRPAELGCGVVVAMGSACAPDLDCPNSSIARCLDPVSYLASRVVAKLSLGHRQGTHSLLAALLITLGATAAVTSSSGRFVELGIAFLAASLVYRVLLDGRGVVCAVLAAATAATLVTIAPEPGYFAGAVIVGYASHIIPGDLVTVEGVPHPLWPLASAPTAHPHHRAHR
jgi:membrane-bound metal-dependent hydrolase YbcI (DUF457 family)